MALKLEAEIVLVKDDKSLLESHTSLIQQNADSITHKVSDTDFNGVTIASLINQTADAVKINANHIVLEGVITANSNFKINLDGSVESIAGKVGGFNIASSKLYAIGVGISLAQANQYVIWAGETNGANGYLSTDAKFRVESNGKVSLENMVATGGSIGGLVIAGGSLTAGSMKLDSVNGRLYFGSRYLFTDSAGIGIEGSCGVYGNVYVNETLSGVNIKCGFGGPAIYTLKMRADGTVYV